MKTDFRCFQSTGRAKRALWGLLGTAVVLILYLILQVQPGPWLVLFTRTKSHPLQLASNVQKVSIDTECSGQPLSIANLPYKPAILSDVTMKPPIERQVLGCRPRTPLFIGFTENEPLLAQAVLSYIACGWPGSDIIVVDNTGSLMWENGNSLDYDTFRRQYGVNILQTPAQLSFSQLQNFYLYTAKIQGWRYFFWSHMDIVVLSHQYPTTSFYRRVISSLTNITAEESTNLWAFGWYGYDKLSLVNVPAASLTGPWDMNIPYYYSDCDYYTRSRLRGFKIIDFEVGHIFDVSSVISDTWQLFNGSYNDIREQLVKLQVQKKDQRATQKLWQGWNSARQIVNNGGKQVYEEKWGTRTCSPRIG